MTQQKANIHLTNWEIVSVNPSDKQWSWKTLFCFWGNSVQSIIGFSLIASLYLVYELNFLIVLTSAISQKIFVFIIVLTRLKKVILYLLKDFYGNIK